MKTRENYNEALKQLYESINHQEGEHIELAARMVAKTVANKHCVFLYDTGHIIDSEMINRAGGFCFLKPFKFSLNTTSDSMDRELPKASTIGLSKFALEKAGIIKGDLLFIGSVSGKSETIVDLALTALDLGIQVIAISSKTYSSQLESAHPSKKKLYEVNDLFIDNCAPYEDAMLEVEGLDEKFAPASGLSAAYIMWCICCDTLDILMQEYQIVPSVLRSVNAPGNRESNAVKDELYKTRGY